MNRALFHLSIIVAALVVAYGCSRALSSDPATETVPLTVLGSGPVADAVDMQPGALWIKDRNQLPALMDRLPGGRLIQRRADGLADIDFAEADLLLIWMGRKRTGGYALDAVGDRAAIENRSAIVPVRRIEPPQGAVVAQMITNPYLLLRIGEGAFDTITIVDPDGPGTMVVTPYP